ncbi:MAG: VapC toxin family PIN domain ribonuclease [Solirubrobacterales bacterium]|nr:MAG: VapC toxin family PIN domain ribonuclease [Solirubrobacterales bacterium]
MPDYLDTSAFIKLVRSEPESRALRAELASGDALVSSVLLVVEGRRAAARYGAVAIGRARAALSTITLLAVDDATLETAADLEPAELRSLDALHLAAALSMAGELGRLYCYDARLSAAAAEFGLDVRQPR